MARLTVVVQGGYIGDCLALDAPDEAAAKGGHVGHPANGTNHVEGSPPLHSASNDCVQRVARGALHVGGSARVFEHETALVANQARITERSTRERLRAAGDPEPSWILHEEH